APARVLNLIAIVDREWRGEIENRLEKVGRYHASRTVLCAVDPRRTTIDARVRLIADEEPQAGEFSLTHEHVVVDIGEQHVKSLDTIVDPLVVADRAYLVDLAWLRSTPWRERIAATFDPPTFRPQLGAITSVQVRHHPESG